NFFFQAEDGIRDFHVTGVQTCALPIFDGCEGVGRGGDGGEKAASDISGGAERSASGSGDGEQDAPSAAGPEPGGLRLGDAGVGRSEERRVGKECRSRGRRVGWKEQEGK